MAVVDEYGTSALWARAVSEYKEKLSQDDLHAVLSVSNSQELLRRLESSEIQISNHGTRMEKIRNGLEKYSVFLSVFGSALPETSALFWGSLDFLHQVYCTLIVVSLDTDRFRCPLDRRCLGS